MNRPLGDEGYESWMTLLCHLTTPGCYNVFYWKGPRQSVVTFDCGELILDRQAIFSPNTCLCIYFFVWWVFIAVCRLSFIAVSGGYSLLSCVGFSLQWFLLLSMGFSSCSVGLSSCNTWAQLLHSMWDLPIPGIEPVSPTRQILFFFFYKADS